MNLLDTRTSDDARSISINESNSAVTSIVAAYTIQSCISSFVLLLFVHNHMTSSGPIHDADKMCLLLI